MTDPDPEPPSPPAERRLQLGGRTVRLIGPAPLVGARVEGTFLLPAFRGSATLAGEHLQRGLHVVATLPNVRKRACAEQVAGLETNLHRLVPLARLSLVTADDDRAWDELALAHPGVRAHAYSLHQSPATDRAAFRRTFGVDVLGERRIARGLSAIRDGVWLIADIPDNQLESPAVTRFLRLLAQLHRLAR